MDSAVVKGVATNHLSMEWTKLKTLGKGSFAIVHLVKPTNSVSDDQVFAMKSCLYQLSSSLQKEQKILKRFFPCRNIVQCYGDMLSCEQGAVVYNLFLEYAPGGSLLDLINNKYGGKVPECDARCYARILVEGVRDIHERGYVHCDLKPGNVLVYPSDEYGSVSSLKIADFGLAEQPGERVDEPGVDPWMLKFPGTAVYMPPEGINYKKISASMDIWSLGCIVLQMVTGKLPWEYEDLTDLAIQLGSRRYSPKISENMSSTGQDFLSKCFVRDPSERWTADMLLSHPFVLPDRPSVAISNKASSP
ncbi:PREDICTED: mitogen-activated protein kinase kinase kinase 2 [Theobroma cacao]|uniref:Mitogen-activated protein kinase kinase kinase 2 n=1 Tax=Theobroma cacao TaxID=3641 RepID=A0AB32W6Z7_THECC|nr:PREDICTED: mitogen-activated protein kinase kinase kinase 2 [Theobroma cacao]